jgi:4,4'-diaponeurosporenoate glycosyltransferase
MNPGDISVIFVVHLVLWILGFFLLFRISYCGIPVHRNPHRRSISVVIPARNEEHALHSLLNSLAGQLTRKDEVIVVDDHSEDKTREVAVSSGMKVLASLPTPEGWIGKTWACYQGADVASGDILIFLDADTVLERNGLESMVETYIEKDGVLSIQPYHTVRDPYEQLSAFFNIIVMAGIGTFTILGKRIRPMGLLGPAVVMKREYYVNSGGHEKVKGEVLDDVAFGAELQRRGMEAHCLGGKGTISFRMYPSGIRELINGWGKGIAIGATKTSIPLLIMIVLWLAGSIGTARSLIEASIAANGVQIAISGSLYVLYAAQIYWMLVRIGSFKFYTALLYIIAAAFFVVVFAYSSVRSFIVKSVKWKGREISLKRKVGE